MTSEPAPTRYQQIADAIRGDSRNGESLGTLLNLCLPLFETLRDCERQSILLQLIERGPQTVNEIAEASALSRPAVSHHLKILARNGMVSVTKYGTRRICQAELAVGIDLLKKLLVALERNIQNAEGLQG